MTVIISFIAILLLIVLSAFFNVSETALTAASRARMHALEDDGNVPAALVNKVLSRPEKMIGTVLLGNTLVDVLAAALASNIAVDLYGQFGVAYATAIITILIVIFAAVLPKTYALAYADRVALVVAPPMQALIYVLTPFTKAIEFIVRHILILTPGKADDAANILAAHEEIRGTIDLQAKEGTVAKGDAEMLGGVLDLRDLQVADIMVHRTKMETIDVDEPPAKILDQLMRSQYTRVPLWKDEPEN
ncbi:CNNM domain-containing protein, partial [Frankia sp. AgW1.1]|uniref:CNNM domain-containing protein n=1 Tax=Frankia sp. AgW1.1 TaxID=1836971 RepID=UPI001931D841